MHNSPSFRQFQFFGHMAAVRHHVHTLPQHLRKQTLRGGTGGALECQKLTLHGTQADTGLSGKMTCAAPAKALVRADVTLGPPSWQSWSIGRVYHRQRNWICAAHPFGTFFDLEALSKTENDKAYQSNYEQGTDQSVKRHGSILTKVAPAPRTAPKRLTRLCWAPKQIWPPRSEMGHFRRIKPLPTLSACPLRSDRVRTLAPQRIDAVCQEPTLAVVAVGMRVASRPPGRASWIAPACGWRTHSITSSARGSSEAPARQDTGCERLMTVPGICGCIRSRLTGLDAAMRELVR
jgi:hypothetical protein